MAADAFTTGVRLTDEQRLDWPASSVVLNSSVSHHVAMVSRLGRDDRRFDFFHRLAVGLWVLEKMPIKIVRHADCRYHVMQ